MEDLITTNDNYKNLLQVQLQQQNFKVTPIYKEINEWDEEEGYHMGVYLSIKFKSHEFTYSDDNVYNIDDFFKTNNIQKEKSSFISSLKSHYDSLIETEMNQISSFFSATQNIKLKEGRAKCM